MAEKLPLMQWEVLTNGMYDWDDVRYMLGDARHYVDARTAKTRANREIALLSHVFIIAMEWGFAERNPCLAVRRNKEKMRDFYAADEIWDAVYTEADQGLKDAMDLAYLAGQRPADTLKFSTVDLDEDYLWVDQNKTDKKLRIRRHVNGELTGLGLFIEALLERRKLQGVRNSRLITNEGLRMSWEMLRNRFSEARDKAARKLIADGNADLATKVRQFQFRDIRPKAASEIEDISHASRLLGHSKEEITKRVYAESARWFPRPSKPLMRKRCLRMRKRSVFSTRKEKTPQKLICGAFEWWRPRSESNRRRRICNPEHNHFATRPQRSDLAACALLSP